MARQNDHQSNRPLTSSNSQSAKQPSHKQPVPQGSNPEQKPPGQQEKVLITGDDILIEYVDRLMNQLKHMGDE